MAYEAPDFFGIDELLTEDDGMIIRTEVKQISQLGRATQGVHLVRLGEEDRVVAVAHIASEDDEEGAARIEASPNLVSPEEQLAQAAAEADDEIVDAEDDSADAPPEADDA